MHNNDELLPAELRPLKDLMAEVASVGSPKDVADAFVKAGLICMTSALTSANILNCIKKDKGISAMTMKMLEEQAHMPMELLNIVIASISLTDEQMQKVMQHPAVKQLVADGVISVKEISKEAV